MMSFQFVSRFQAVRDMGAPDGRALYAYRVPAAEFDEMQTETGVGCVYAQVAGSPFE